MSGRKGWGRWLRHRSVGGQHLWKPSANDEAAPDAIAADFAQPLWYAVGSSDQRSMRLTRWVRRRSCQYAMAARAPLWCREVMSNNKESRARPSEQKVLQCGVPEKVIPITLLGCPDDTFSLQAFTRIVHSGMHAANIARCANA